MHLEGRDVEQLAGDRGGAPHIVRHPEPPGAPAARLGGRRLGRRGRRGLGAGRALPAVGTALRGHRGGGSGAGRPYPVRRGTGLPARRRRLGARPRPYRGGRATQLYGTGGAVSRGGRGRRGGHGGGRRRGGRGRRGDRGHPGRRGVRAEHRGLRHRAGVAAARVVAAVCAGARADLARPAGLRGGGALRPRRRLGRHRGRHGRCGGRRAACAAAGGGPLTVGRYGRAAAAPALDEAHRAGRQPGRGGTAVVAAGAEEVRGELGLQIGGGRPLAGLHLHTGLHERTELVR